MKSKLRIVLVVICVLSLGCQHIPPADGEDSTVNEEISDTIDVIDDTWPVDDSGDDGEVARGEKPALPEQAVPVSDMTTTPDDADTPQLAIEPVEEPVVEETLEPPAVTMDEPPASRPAEPEEKIAESKPEPVAVGVTELARPPDRSGRFRRLTQNCTVLEQASPEAKPLNSLFPGRKLWTESAGEGWLRVYRKNGVGFLPATCFQTPPAVAAVSPPEHRPPAEPVTPSTPSEASPTASTEAASLPEPPPPPPLAAEPQATPETSAEPAARVPEAAATASARPESDDPPWKAATLAMMTASLIINIYLLRRGRGKNLHTDKTLIYA